MTWALLASLALSASPAWGQEVFATQQAAGIRSDAAGEVGWRAAGEADWRVGHPLVEIAGGRFVGSLFWLQPDTAYEARVGDGPAVAFRTQPDPPAAHASDRTLVVDPGDPAAFSTITAAAAEAGPGTLVLVRPGVYRETVEVSRSGEPGRPVVFRADGDGAVLDGADAGLASGDADWQDLGDGVYRTAFAGRSLYVQVDGERIYDYSALDDLLSEAGDLPGGFYVDEDAGQLHMRLPDRSNPTGRPVHVATLPGGFHLEDQHDVVIEGFEIRHYGSVRWTGYGVDIRSSDRVLVRDNHIHHLNTGVRMRKGSADNVVQDNEIEDDGAWRWPWGSVKAHTPEASGIAVGGGRGNVVRRNRITGPFNGIYVGEFTDDPDEGVATETDVYDNVIVQASDDGLEPEGACVNVRFWNNVIDQVHNAVSFAPIQVGPTWLIRNTITSYSAHALKLNNGSAGPILAYHNTATPAAGEAGAAAQAWAPSLPFGPLTSRNNAWSARRYVIELIPDTLLAPVDIDHDAFFTDRDDGGPILKWLNVRYDTLAEFTAATGLQEHGLFARADDPSLRDAGALLPGINDAVADGRPDIGAVERVTLPAEGEGEGEGAGAGAGAGEGEGEGGDRMEGAPRPEAGGRASGCRCRAGLGRVGVEYLRFVGTRR